MLYSRLGSFLVITNRVKLFIDVVFNLAAYAHYYSNMCVVAQYLLANLTSTPNSISFSTKMASCQNNLIRANCTLRLTARLILFPQPKPSDLFYPTYSLCLTLVTPMQSEMTSLRSLSLFRLTRYPFSMSWRREAQWRTNIYFSFFSRTSLNKATTVMAGRLCMKGAYELVGRWEPWNRVPGSEPHRSLCLRLARSYFVFLPKAVFARPTGPIVVPSRSIAITRRYRAGEEPNTIWGTGFRNAAIGFW